MKTTKWKSTTKWLGLTPYNLALDEQMSLWKDLHVRGAHHEGVLLGCEHKSSITLGRRSTETEVLTNTDIPIFKVDRGGQATLHSPGQLVIYPLFALRETGLGVRDFVCLLLQTTASLLLEIGIASENREDAGLYTSDGKICFVGLRVEKGITRHGLSLNVSNDLDLFRQIRACGVQSQAMDSVAKHLRPPSLESLFQRWSQIFIEKLN